MWYDYTVHQEIPREHISLIKHLHFSAEELYVHSGFMKSYMYIHT